MGSGSIQDYLQDDLKDVPTISYDLPYEKVLSFEPDLLLISSSATVEGGKYEHYSKIAPITLQLSCSQFYLLILRECS